MAPGLTKYSRKSQLNQSRFLTVRASAGLFVDRKSPTKVGTLNAVIPSRFLTHIVAFPTITPCDRAKVAAIFEMGTYVNGRRLPLQGRGWGFESLRAHQFEISDLRFEI